MIIFHKIQISYSKLNTEIKSLPIIFMKSLIILFISTQILLLNNCSGKRHQSTVIIEHDQNAQLIVYGSPDCIHCIHFIDELDSSGIKYDFRAVTSDTAMFNEMMRKIHIADVKGYISYPVDCLHKKGDAVQYSPLCG